MPNTDFEAAPIRLRAADRRSWRAIQESWRTWLGATLLAFAAALGTVLGSQPWRFASAVALGVTAIIALVGWAIGGHVSSLRWLWGAQGEQWTGEALLALPPEYAISRSDGHGGHVVVGPGGVFLLETKYVSLDLVTVSGDALHAGRISHPGGRARSAAAALGAALNERSGLRPGAQAVVVVWGDFPRRIVEHARVVYVHGEELCAWLERQPPRLGDAERATIAAAARECSNGARARVAEGSRP